MNSRLLTLIIILGITSLQCTSQANLVNKINEKIENIESDIDSRELETVLRDSYSERINTLKQISIIYDKKSYKFILKELKNLETDIKKNRDRNISITEKLESLKQKMKTHSNNPLKKE